MDNSEEKNEKKQKKVKISTVFYVLLIILILYIVTMGVVIYAFGVDTKVAKLTAKIVPYPAVIINNKNFIRISELEEDLQSVRRFYEVQDFSEVGLRIDFTTEDGKKRLKVREKQILNKMIEDRIIEILARQNGIKVTNEVADQEISRIIREFGNKEATKKDLKRLYDWTLEDFRDKIVKPDLRRERVMDFYDSQDNSGKEAKNKIQKAKSELSNGKSFEDVAREYSEEQTAVNGGAEGWFKEEHLLPDLAETVFSMEVGERSNIIESELGYHIIEVNEKKSENEVELINISQVFVQKNNFVKWLEEEMVKMRIRVLIYGYEWNGEKLIVQFEDEELEKFEEGLLDNSQGDASVIF